MLALLPLDPGDGVVAGGEPAVDCALELGLMAQAAGEGDVGDVEVEPPPQLDDVVRLEDAYGREGTSAP